MTYIPPPETLLAFPSAKRVRSKTPVQGGGGFRKRWADPVYIYEWDSLHGIIEKYNRKGKHLGEFDHETGEQLKPADRTRSIKP